MNKISDQIRSSFNSSLPVIDDQELCMAISDTVKGCSIPPSTHRASIIKIALRLIKYIGWKIWLIQGLCLIGMLRLFVSIGGQGLISIPLAAIRGLCIISASIPFITIPFIHRSIVYKMHETEMSTYLSYGRQMLIKLFVIGIGDLIMLTSGLYVAVFILDLHTVSALIYGMFPFLFMKSITLFVLSHYHADNAFWIYGILYVISITSIELFVKYYPLESISGKIILLSIMVFLVIALIQTLKDIVYSESYRELNLAK